MSCKKYRLLISAYIDNEVNDSEKKDLDVHLKTCNDCNNYLNDLLKMQMMFEKVEKKEVLDNIEEKIIDKIGDDEIRIKKRSGFLYGFSVVFLMLAVFVTGLLSVRPVKSSNVSDIWPVIFDEKFEEEIVDIYYG